MSNITPSPVVINSTIIYSTRNKYEYSNSPTKKNNTFYLPVELDTEYYHPPVNLSLPANTSLCTNITVQCRHIDKPTGVIFAHPDIKAIARHPIFNTGCAVVDYLISLGHDVSLTRVDALPTNLPTLELDIYAFFAVAEIARVFTGVFLGDILDLIVGRDKWQGISQERRLRCWTKTANGSTRDYCSLPWVIVLDGVAFAVRLAVFDTSAVHGGESNYATFCENSGVTLENKELFSKEDKGKMLEMYTTRPSDFDAYSLGDLYNYDALKGNATMFKAIYSTLGLEHLYQAPSLTTGATVKNILEASIANLFENKTPKEVIEPYCIKSSADYLKRIHKRTGALNSKVDGGRCRNNRPTSIRSEGLLADIDIAGCYGEGLRNQLYPLGNPVLIDYPTDSDGTNGYQTLRQFIKTYGKELVPGLWQARVTSKNTHKYKQDFLVSWMPPKDISKMTTDSNAAGTDNFWELEGNGDTKIFTNEVNNAVITHDFIQWLDNIASPRQRKELLDNLLVVTALFYPASERVNTVQELEDARANHNGVNTSTAKLIKGKTTRIEVNQDCHKWYAVNMGDLLVTRLLLARKEQPKETPLNKLYKLVINTVYGDLVSPFFTVGNVVVGNNVTARARALAWYMEKGLHGYQTITDGCVFDVNKVLAGKVNGENVVGLFDKDAHDYGMSFAPLGGQQLETIELQWLDNAAMEHLQNLFPTVDVLHQSTFNVFGAQRVGQYSFETKGIYCRASSHGTANYLLDPGNGEEYKIKMRSYKKHSVAHYGLDNNENIIETGLDNPAYSFLVNLLEGDLSRLDRGKVFLKENILKAGDYAANFSSRYTEAVVYPGMTVRSASKLTELSLSQFTFNTLKQYESWVKDMARLKRSFGQGYEMYFMNDDGTLDYERMITTVNEDVSSGAMKLQPPGGSHNANRYQQEHPSLKTLLAVKSRLNKLQGIANGDEL